MAVLSDYEALIMADGPQYYWPMQSVDTYDAGGGNHFYAFKNIVDGSTGGLNARVHDIVIGGYAAHSASAVIAKTPGLVCGGSMPQWVPALGVGTTNDFLYGYFPYLEPIGEDDFRDQNEMTPSSGSLEVWFRWSDPLAAGVGSLVYGSPCRWYLHTVGADLHLHYGGNGGASAEGILKITHVAEGGTDGLADGNLHHLVATFDRTTHVVKVYIDGQNRAGTQIPGLTAGVQYADGTDWVVPIFGGGGSGNASEAAASMAIGGSNNTYGFAVFPTDARRNFNGQLGHIAVYQSQLTPTQVLLHYEYGALTTGLPSPMASHSGMTVTGLQTARPHFGSHSGMQVHGHISGIRVVHIQGTFAPLGTALAGATVWFELGGWVGNDVVMHKSGRVVGVRSDTYTTDSSAHLSAFLAAPGDLVVDGLFWVMHWTGGTPV